MTLILLIIWVAVIYLRPQEVLPEIKGFPLLDIVGGITFALWLTLLMGRRSRLAPGPQNYLIGLLILSMMLSRMANLWFGGALLVLTEFGTIAVLYLILSNVLDSPRKIKIFVFFLVLLATVLAIQGIYQFHLGSAFGGQSLIEGRIRGTGIFGDPNDLALSLVVVVPFALSIMGGKGWGSGRLVALASLPAVLYALYLTNSRGGIIALVATLILYFCLKSGTGKGLLVGGIAVLVLLIFAPSRMQDIALATSDRSRLIAWGEGLQMLKNSPLLGVGWNGFTEAHEFTAHNSLLLVGAEMGIIGMFAWLSLIYISFRSLYHCVRLPASTSREIADLKFLSKDVTASLSGILVGAMFLSRAYNVLLWLLLALALALGHTAYKRGAIEMAGFHPREWLRVFFLMVGGIISFYLIIKVMV